MASISACSAPRVASVIWGAAARPATSSSAARTGYISPISFSVMVRTRTPRWASLSTKRIASRSRSASRIGAWLTPYSFMRWLSTMRSPGA